MSASLDDLEPYEIFQQELDEYLKTYKKEIFNSIEDKNQLYIPHTFIEYFCFINPKISFNDIAKEEITDGFLPYTIEKYNHAVNPNEIKSSLLKFLIFINSKCGKLSEILIDLNTL